MRILQAHNYYQRPGGEDRVLAEENKLLIKRGHEVFQFTKHNKSITSIFGKLKSLFTTYYSKSAYREFKDFLVKLHPDIVHVHNFFPLISPSVFDACNDLHVPSVLTLHNYRLIHPNGLLLSRGKIDERSIKGSAYECVKDGVYRNSVIATAVVAHMIEYHRRKKTWEKNVSGFIALSEFAKKKFVEGGIPEEKIYVKPNFMEDQGGDCNSSFSRRERNFFLYVGRISEEKGIKTLIQSWIQFKIPIPVYVVGDGPLLSSYKKKCINNRNIIFLGHKKKEEVSDLMKRAIALIFPSIWYEGCPLAILEAFSSGLPVLSSNIGAHSTMVNCDVNGIHFEKSNPESLMRSINKLLSNSELWIKLAKGSRRTYEKRYTPVTNYEKLMMVYQEAVENENVKSS